MADREREILSTSRGPLKGRLWLLDNQSQGQDYGLKAHCWCLEMKRGAGQEEVSEGNGVTSYEPCVRGTQSRDGSSLKPGIQKVSSSL